MRPPKHENGTPARRGLSLLAALLALAGVHLGCNDARLDSAPDRVELHPMEGPTETQPTEVAPAPPVELSDRPEYRTIMDAFERNASELFRRPDIESRLDQIEQVYVSTGHYLKLVAIYQRVVDDQGIGSPAATRLAWAYVRLGQRTLALDLLDRLAEERPDSARVAYLRGALWFDRAAESRSAATKAERYWRRALDRDADFTGYGGVGADQIRRQIERLERGLSAPRAEQTPGRQPTPSAGDGEVDPATIDGSSETSSATSAGPGPSESSGPDPGARRSENEAAPEARSSESASSHAVETNVVRGQMALEEGNLDRAASHFRRAVEGEAAHFGAELGLLRVRRRRGADTSAVTDDLESMVERRDLTARQAYEAGLFARAKLGDSELSNRLLERVRRLDPAFARRVGIDSLLD